MNSQQQILRKKYLKYGYNKRFAFAEGFYYDEDRGLYKKINRTGWSKSVKKQANKQIRRMNKEISNYSGYRKESINWLWLF